MKPIPPPDIPGKTEFERFDNALRQVLTVTDDCHEEHPKAQQKKPPKPKK